MPTNARFIKQYFIIEINLKNGQHYLKEYAPRHRYHLKHYCIGKCEAISLIFA